MILSVLCLAVVTGTLREASAQTASMSMVVQSSSHLCLAIAPANGPATGTAPPAPGWRVVVEPCDGRSTQRFIQLYGDSDEFMHDAGSCLVPDAAGTRVVLGSCGRGRALERNPVSLDGGPGTFRVGDRCMTAPVPGSRYVTLAPCDGRPEQTWTASRP